MHIAGIAANLLAMKRTSGTDPSRAQHRALVEHIVSMRGAMKKSLRSEHHHVRDALARLRDEKRALQVKLHPDGVLHRAGRKI